MSERTPLELIPTRFAGDPPAGLAEIMRYLDRPGTKMDCYKPVKTAWIYSFHIPGQARYDVMYEEIDPSLAAGAYETVKAASIKKWLHDLTNVVRLYRGVSTLEFGQLDRDTTIREALQTAAAKPVTVARTKAQPVDAFVARVLARRGTGTPTV